MKNIKSTDSLYLYQYSKYILDLLPNYIQEIKFLKNKLFIYVYPNKINIFMLFLKTHINSLFVQLVDICGLDWLSKKFRFEVIYNLLSLQYSSRICIKVLIQNNSLVSSVSKIYKSAIWLEREVWDMFGIFFSNHPDLRRILTDYGFEGYPFRKDFPQTGFIEIRYDDQKKLVLYEPVELAQEFRFFDFLSPWIQVK